MLVDSKKNEDNSKMPTCSSSIRGTVGLYSHVNVFDLAAATVDDNTAATLTGRNAIAEGTEIKNLIQISQFLKRLSFKGGRGDKDHTSI